MFFREETTLGNGLGKIKSKESKVPYTFKYTNE